MSKALFGTFAPPTLTPPPIRTALAMADRVCKCGAAKTVSRVELCSHCDAPCSVAFCEHCTNLTTI